jgi:hypothetical protein
MNTIHSQSADYTNMVSSVADYLEHRGFESIKADTGEYEKPAQLTRQGTDEGYIPDLTARKNGGKHYFEIVLEDKNEQQEMIGKWRLFSTLAEHRNGKFTLLVPHGKMSFTNRILGKYGIKADVMKLTDIMATAAND